MVLHAGRRGGELGHEFGVHQEALGQVSQLGHLDRPQDFGQPGGHAVDLIAAEDEEIGFVDFVGPGAADRARDELHVALEELRVALDVHVVAVFERAVVVLAGIPQPGCDRPAAVGKLQLQVEVAVAVWPQLLIGSQEHLADLFVVAELSRRNGGRSWWTCGGKRSSGREVRGQSGQQTILGAADSGSQPARRIGQYDAILLHAVMP